MTTGSNCQDAVLGLAALPDGTGGICPCPDVMTQEELIRYLRIPDVSKSQNPANVVANLVRVHGLPCIHICRQPLYPLNAVRQWVREKVAKEQSQ